MNYPTASKQFGNKRATDGTRSDIDCAVVAVGNPGMQVCSTVGPAYAQDHWHDGIFDEDTQHGIWVWFWSNLIV